MARRRETEDLPHWAKIGAMLEAPDKKVDRLAEGARLDRERNDERFDRIDERFDRVETRLDGLERYTRNIDRQAAETIDRLDRFEADSIDHFERLERQGVEVLTSLKRREARQRPDHRPLRHDRLRPARCSAPDLVR